MSALLGQIEPCVKEACTKCPDEDKIAAEVENLNIDKACTKIASYPAFASLDDLAVYGAKYDIETGKISGWKRAN